MPVVAMRLFCLALLALLGTAAGTDLTNAERLYQNGDFAAAFREFRTLAESGVPAAQVRLGEMYREGKGTEQDQLEFAHWFWEAAKNGRPDAARVVGWPIRGANPSALGKTDPFLLTKIDPH